MTLPWFALILPNLDYIMHAKAVEYFYLFVCEAICSHMLEVLQ